MDKVQRVRYGWQRVEAKVKIAQQTIDRTSNPTFIAFLDDHRLRGIRGDNPPYTVESQSGQSYTVSLTSSIGGYDILTRSTWNCTCPSRRTCRHIMAVVDMRWAEIAVAEDRGSIAWQDAIDDMEREGL